MCKSAVSLGWQSAVLRGSNSAVSFGSESAVSQLLRLNQLVVESSSSHQFLVNSHLPYLALVKDGDNVRILNSRESMCDHNTRPTLPCRIQSRLKDLRKNHLQPVKVLFCHGHSC